MSEEQARPENTEGQILFEAPPPYVHEPEPPEVFNPAAYQPRTHIHFTLHIRDHQSHYLDLMVAHIGYFSPDVKAAHKTFYPARLEQLSISNEDLAGTNFHVRVKINLTVYAHMEDSDLKTPFFMHDIPTRFCELDQS
jgi:hypothetical protein